MRMWRRKGKGKCCLLKKISRHVPRKMLYSSVPSRKPYLPSPYQRLASSVPGKLRFSSLHPLIFIELYLSIFPFFSPPPPLLSSLFYLSTHPLLYTFSRRDKIHSRERMYSFRCLYFAVLSVPSVVEVPLVLPLLREKVFECISTFPWNVLHLQFLFLNLFSRQSFTLTYVCVQIVFFI